MSLSTSRVSLATAIVVSVADAETPGSAVEVAVRVFGARSRPRPTTGRNLDADVDRGARLDVGVRAESAWCTSRRTWWRSSAPEVASA